MSQAGRQDFTDKAASAMKVRRHYHSRRHPLTSRPARQPEDRHRAGLRLRQGAIALTHPSRAFDANRWKLGHGRLARIDGAAQQ